MSDTVGRLALRALWMTIADLTLAWGNGKENIPREGMNELVSQKQIHLL